MITLRQIAGAERDMGILQDSEAFAERLLSNYGLIQMKLSPETMLHTLAGGRPDPDGYRAGGLTQSFHISQQVEIGVVNQIVNRMKNLVQNGGVYQDKVFVEAALRKMGIRNAEEFIRMAVRASGLEIQKRRLAVLAQTEEQAEQAVRKRLAKKKRRFWKRKSDMEKEDAENFKAGRALRRKTLYEEVAKRLGGAEAGRLYREFGFHTAFVQGQVPEHFFPMIEQCCIEHGLSVQRLERNGFLLENGGAAMMFNPYEHPRSLGESIEEKQLKSGLLSAVLFNMVRDTALYGALRQGRGGIRHIDIRNAAEHGMRMTMERFFRYHRNVLTADMENQKLLMETLESGFASEIRILRRIYDVEAKKENESEFYRLKQTRHILEGLLKGQKKELDRALDEQGMATVRAVSKIEKEIRGYLSQADIRHVAGQEQWIWEPVRTVHIRNEAAGDRFPAQDESAEERWLTQGAVLREQGFSDRREIRRQLDNGDSMELSRMIRNNIREQMGTLTDKVYTRLGKRLLDERKRWGM